MTIVSHSPVMDTTENKLDPERGKRIKHIRENVLPVGNVSQEKFAELISNLRGESVSRGAVGNWELGKGMSRENMMAIASLARVEVIWIAVGGEPWPTREEPRPGSCEPINSAPIPIEELKRHFATVRLWRLFGNILEMEKVEDQDRLADLIQSQLDARQSENRETTTKQVR